MLGWAACTCSSEAVCCDCVLTKAGPGSSDQNLPERDPRLRMRERAPSDQLTSACTGDVWTTWPHPPMRDRRLLASENHARTWDRRLAASESRGDGLSFSQV